MENNIISWYDFNPGSRVLFLGEKESEMYRCIKEKCKKVDVVAGKKEYDYVIMISDEIDFEELNESLGKLKKVALEEWNSIPKGRILKSCQNYNKRLEKVIEIKGNRLEDFHLKQIRKNGEGKKEEEEEINEMEEEMQK